MGHVVSVSTLIFLSFGCSVSDVEGLLYSPIHLSEHLLLKYLPLKLQQNGQ